MNVMEVWTGFGSREGVVLVSRGNDDETEPYCRVACE